MDVLVLSTKLPQLDEYTNIPSDNPMVKVATDLSLAFASFLNYLAWDYV